MNSYKEAIEAKLKAKKEQTQVDKNDKRAIYDVKGEKRGGVKKFKKGGLFDK